MDGSNGSLIEESGFDSDDREMMRDIRLHAIRIIGSGAPGTIRDARGMDV